MDEEKQLTNAISKELVNTSIDTSLDYAEMGINEIFDSDTLKEVPIVKTLVSFIKIGINIKEKFFIKKLLTFLKEYNDCTIEQVKLDEFKERFDNDKKHREKVTEQIMIFLDAHLTIEKSKILAKLFRSYVEGKYEWEYFNSLSTCLNSLYPESFGYLRRLSQHNFKIPTNPERDELGIVHDLSNEALLNASGLAYNASVWDSAFEVSKMGQDLFIYGIK